MLERDLATIETFISNINDLALGNSPRWIYVWRQLAGSASGRGLLVRSMEGKSPYALAICGSDAHGWPKTNGGLFATCLADGKILRSVRIPQ